MIAVLDYGIGNLRSAEKALCRVGGDAQLVTDPDAVDDADGVVLPGVGAFGRCAEALRFSGLDVAALSAIERGIPFLGICVGLQLLFDRSDESPGVKGLGVLPGQIVALPRREKSPQIQWNVLDIRGSDRVLTAGLPSSPWVYFVHSYAPEFSSVTREFVSATCDYGGEVVASIERHNVVGTQFHPEKSGTIGLSILGNFVAMVNGRRS